MNHCVNFRLWWPKIPCQSLPLILYQFSSILAFMMHISIIMLKRWNIIAIQGNIKFVHVFYFAFLLIKLKAVENAPISYYLVSIQVNFGIHFQMCVAPSTAVPILILEIWHVKVRLLQIYKFTFKIAKICSLWKSRFFWPNKSIFFTLTKRQLP